MSLKGYFKDKISSFKASIENDRKLSNQMYEEIDECYQEIKILQEEIDEFFIDHKNGIQAMMSDIKKVAYYNSRVELKLMGDKAVEELEKI